MASRSLVRRLYSTAESVPVRSNSGGGRFKGGLFGLVAGASVSLYIGYYHLVDEYSDSVHKLIGSVEQLQGTTSQLKKHSEKVLSLESQLGELKSKFASLDSLKASEKHILKTHDDSVVEHLKLKNQVFELERSLHDALDRLQKVEKTEAPQPKKP